MILLCKVPVNKDIRNYIEVEPRQDGVERTGQPLLEFIEIRKGPSAQKRGYLTRGTISGDIQQQPVVVDDKARDNLLPVMRKIIELLNEFVCSRIMTFHKHRLHASGD
jgi:hypothetical protein